MTTLRRGDQGAEVEALQERLADVGWYVEPHGRYEHTTEAAVRCFQKDSRGLLDDGIAGPRTLGALDTAPSSPEPPSAPFKWKVDMPWFSQRDNHHAPSGTCNVTCLAMVLSRLGVVPRQAGKQLEDELFEDLESPEGQAYFRKTYAWADQQGLNARNVHGMLTWLAERYGRTARRDANADWSDVVRWAQRGRPTIISGRFTGSGHIICLVGETLRGDALVHDPWGDWERGYAPGHHDGAYRIYGQDRIRDVFKGVAHYIE